MNNKILSTILLNIVVLVLGGCLVLWADKVTSLVSVFLGCLAVLYGIIEIIIYFKTNDKIFIDVLHFIYGIFVMVIGFVLIFRVYFLKELISFIMGIYIVLSSIIKLHEAIIVKKNSNINSAVVLSIVGIVVGVLCLVGKFLVPNIIVTFIGIMLIFYSIIDTCNLVILNKNK